jgi:WD40 repeat protein
MRHHLGYLLIVSLASFAASEASADSLPPGNQKPPAKAKPPRTDSFGDPLPEGVFYRLGTVRLRHQNTHALIFYTDGSKLLSQGWTPDFRVWDVATGRLLQQFPAPEGRSRLIASPDDRYLACVANSHQVILLDKASGKELARWNHRLSWLSLGFSKDGKELVGLTREETVVKWNIAERKEISRLRLDMTKVDVKNFFDHWGLSPDGGIAAFMPPVASGENASAWHFWDTATGKQCRPPLVMQAHPSQVFWSADGQNLAVAGRDDNTLEVWDTVAGKRVVLKPPKSAKNRHAGTDGVERAAFQPGGKLLAVCRLNRVVVWDLDARKQAWEQDVSASALAFSRDGKTLAVGGGGAIVLLEAATGERVGFSRRDPGSASLAGWWSGDSFCFDSRSFVVYDQAGISQIDTATGKRLRSYPPGKNGFSYGGLCDNGKLFACVGSVDGAAHLFMFDAVTGKELWRRTKQPSEFHFAADGKTLAVLSWEGDEFTLVDAATGRDVKKLPAPVYRYDGNTCRTFSGDLRLAASAHNVGGLYLWDLATGKKLRSLECPPAAGEGSLTFVAGKKQIVWARARSFHSTETQRESGCVWEVETGRKLRSFATPIYQISPDRRWLALEDDKGIAIRHLQTGRLVVTIAGSFPSANSHPLAFSPDGSMVAVRNAARDEVGVWDTFTGRLVRRWVDPLYQFHAPAFSPDGRTVLLPDWGEGSMLVCDVTGRATEPGKIPAHNLTPAEADRLWLDLTSDDGSRSQRARWTLVAGGGTTVKMLQRSLRRVELPDAEDISALIAALNSGNFKERDKSSRVLERMELARPALEEALKRNPPVEMKRRIELILAKQDGLPWDLELRRAMRGVLLLEQIGSPPARQLLQTLANGAAGVMLTQEARSALHRMTLSGGPQ